jgi:hypothetical protein
MLIATVSMSHGLSYDSERNFGKEKQGIRGKVVSEIL